MRRFAGILLLPIILLGSLLFLLQSPARGADARVASPCDEAAFDNALANLLATGGGTLLFDCPGATTIPFTVLKTIDQPIRIDGAGQITLSGGGATRFFDVLAGAELTLDNLTLAEGSAPTGGAIYVEGTLTLNHTTIRDSLATDLGSAIHSYQGNVTLNGSRIAGNQAGVSAAVLNEYGTLTINDSIIEGNLAPSSAGIESTGDLAIYDTLLATNLAQDGYGGALGIINGTALIESSVLQNNASATGGGAIYISPDYQAQVTIRRSTIADNYLTATGYESLRGGGIHNGAHLTLEDSTVLRNAAHAFAGIYSYGPNSTLTIRGSTIIGNQAAAMGGGVGLAGGTNLLENATISGNRAADQGGGLLIGGGVTSIINVTLAGNHAPGGANLWTSQASVALANSILGMPVGGLNCALFSAAASDGYNVASDDSCGLEGTGDRQDVDPLLGLLADNGGPTLSHLPLNASPAIDAIPPDHCPAIDQRGYLRPAGAGCDAGAVETAGTEPSPDPAPLPLIPIENQITWPDWLNATVIRYPLGKIKIPDIIDPQLATKHKIDVTICLYRGDMGGDDNPNRDPYETIIDFFADGIYEMSNSAHVLRYVTFIYGCNPGVSQNMTGTDSVVTVDSAESLYADIVWRRQLWPHVNDLSGYGVAGSHLFMADRLTFQSPPMNALAPANAQQVGYTLAHEWGHYMYGMGDEYPQANVACDPDRKYQGPCRDDKGVVPSIMSCQFRAVDFTECGAWSREAPNGFGWLNFSSAASGNKQNAHYRIYQADAWTTLARPASQDPPEIYKLPSNFDPNPNVLKRAVVFPRYYFPELAALAPRKGVTFTIELPASAADRERGIARRALYIFWKRQGQRSGGGGPLALEPRLNPFHRCLTCPERVFGRNDFIYPNPVEFTMQLQREYPIAQMQVLAEVTAPDGSKRQAPVMDDGAGGYRAQLPYHMGGQYLVQFTFTNPNLAARFTNAGLEYIPSATGLEPPVIDEPVGVPFTVTVTTSYTVTGFAADDHGDTMATATVLAADDSVIGGRMDRAGDVDQFTVVASQSGPFVVRVVDLSPGMRPRLTVTRGDGEVLFNGAFDGESAPYLFASLNVQAGERLYAAVTDAAPGEGNVYQISAGHPLATATENSAALFLPIVVR